MTTKIENRRLHALQRLEITEVLLMVLVLSVGLLAALYFSRTYFWIGLACFVAALLLRNKIEDWFIDLRDYFQR